MKDSSEAELLRMVVGEDDRHVSRVPVGWRKVQLPPKGMLSIDGLPISIGEVSHDQDVETAICATPGQSCRVSFTLPNFAEPHGEPLKTGELKFVVVLDSDR